MCVCVSVCLYLFCMLVCSLVPRLMTRTRRAWERGYLYVHMHKQNAQSMSIAVFPSSEYTNSILTIMEIVCVCICLLTLSLQMKWASSLQVGGSSVMRVQVGGSLFMRLGAEAALHIAISFLLEGCSLPWSGGVVPHTHARTRTHTHTHTHVHAHAHTQPTHAYTHKHTPHTLSQHNITQLVDNNHWSTPN